MLITATILSIIVFINRIKLEKRNLIFLIAINILSVLALLWGLYRQEYIVRTDFTTLQTIIMMSIIVLNGLILTVLGCRKNKNNIKLLTLGIFMLFGVIVIPHMSLLFNSLLCFVVVILVLLPNEEYENTIDKYIKNLITSKSKSIDERIYEANPHVTITARTLGELIRMSLIGSNHKYSILKSVFRELELSKSDLTFDLALLRGLLESVEDNPQKANIFFKKAHSVAKGNLELYMSNFLAENEEMLEDIYEDLDGEERSELKKCLEQCNALKSKLIKLKN